MKRLIISLVLLVAILLAQPADSKLLAQAAPKVEDFVFVTAQKLAVYLQPEAKAPIVEEMIPGMVSHILKTQQDSGGTLWIYLADNAFGWVQSTVDGVTTVAPYSVQALQQFIDGQTAVIKRSPRSALPYRDRGTAYGSLHQFAKALADYDTAIKLAPKDGSLYDYRGKINLAARRYEQQIADVTKAISLNRRLAATFNRLALGYQNLDQYDKALTAYAQAISVAPGYGLLYSNRAEVFAGQDNPDKAIQEYTDAIRRDPLLAIAYNWRGRNYENQQQYFRALADYNKALEIDPHCSGCYLNRGAFFANVNSDENAAVRDFNSVIENDPYNARGYTNLAVSYLLAGQRDLAMEHIQKALNVDPEDDYTQFTAGSFYARNGEYDKALQAYTKTIALNRHFAYSSKLYRPQLFFIVGKYDEALADLSDYLGNTHEEYFLTVARLLHGTANLYKLNYGAALLDYQTVWSNSTEADFARGYAYQGRGFRVTPLRESFIETLARTAKNAKNYPKTLYHAATLCMEFGRWQDADTYYRQYFAAIKQPVPDALSKLLALIKT